MAGGRLWTGPADSDPGAGDQVDEAAAAFGLVIVRDDEPTDSVFYLWPENEQDWQMWIDVQTQWRIGMAGPTGLDYAGVDALLRMRGIRGAERAARFDLLQLMERAALAEWSQRVRDGAS